MKAYQLYRHFDAEGALLYAGISFSALFRLAQHRRSEWFWRITKVTIETFRSKRAALKAEREVIKREKPKHNVTHTRNGWPKSLMMKVPKDLRALGLPWIFKFTPELKERLSRSEADGWNRSWILRNAARRYPKTFKKNPHLALKHNLRRLEKWAANP